MNAAVNPGSIGFRRIALFATVALASFVLLSQFGPPQADASTAVASSDAQATAKAGKQSQAKRKAKARAARKIGPAGLSFYRPNKPLPQGHGRLIWQRKVAVIPSSPLRGRGVSSTPPPPLPASGSPFPERSAFPRAKPPGTVGR